MSLLVIQPALKKCEYSIFNSDLNKVVLIGTLGTRSDWIETAGKICEDCQKRGFFDAIKAIAIKVLFGGDEFDRPVTVDEDVLRRLEKLVPQAPLHLPVTLQLIEGCREVFGQIPVVLVFETSFFVNLPQRESMYGIPLKMAEDMKIRRFGYNGIYHIAASQFAIRNLRNEGLKEANRVISICLEVRPEAAAVRGNRVLMVTGGATAIEGIPGEVSCGEIDPSIVLTLAKKNKWGPEHINTVLTRGSGLKGLIGEARKLTEVFDKTKGENGLARRILRYRMLNAAGAAVAAMGGVDAVVFSGRHIEAAGFIQMYLNDNLFSKLNLQHKEVKFYTLKEPLAKIIAEQVKGMVLFKISDTFLR